jgi:hypothetical protein
MELNRASGARHTAQTLPSRKALQCAARGALLRSLSLLLLAPPHGVGRGQASRGTWLDHVYKEYVNNGRTRSNPARRGKSMLIPLWLPCLAVTVRYAMHTTHVYDASRGFLTCDTKAFARKTRNNRVRPREIEPRLQERVMAPRLCPLLLPAGGGLKLAIGQPPGPQM